MASKGNIFPPGSKNHAEYERLARKQEDGDSKSSSDEDFERKHPRGEKGTPKGGQFVRKDGSESSGKGTSRAEGSKTDPKKQYGSVSDPMAASADAGGFLEAQIKKNPALRRYEEDLNRALAFLKNEDDDFANDFMADIPLALQGEAKMALAKALEGRGFEVEYQTYEDGSSAPTGIRKRPKTEKAASEVTDVTDQIQLNEIALDDAYLEAALAEAFTKPGTANVSPADRAKLRGLINHYMKMAHPFTQCVRDQIKHGLSEDHANRRCAVLKDLGTGTTKWREGGGERKNAELEVLKLAVPEAEIREGLRALAETPEEYFRRFVQAQRDAAGTMGMPMPQMPQEFETPQQALHFITRLTNWVRDTLFSTNHPEPYLSEGDGDPADGNVARAIGPEKINSEIVVRKSPKKMSEEPHNAYLTPLLSERAQEVRLANGKKGFWKQILPVGKRIAYQGGQLKTDREFLQRLADNINSGRHPAPFVISQEKDAHAERPDYAKGLIREARLTDGGLEVLVEPRGEEAERFLTDFPECPVSAFYDEDYTDRGTGEKVGPRLFHVAATWRPYINEMEGFRVAASEADYGDVNVVDLSGEEYASPATDRKEEGVLTEVKDTETREEVQMSENGNGGSEASREISLSEFQAMERRLAAAEAAAEAERTARRNERTLSHLRAAYGDATEAQVQAAFRLLTAPDKEGNAAVRLSETGEVELADDDNDARGGYVRTLLEGCRGSAPRLGERGAAPDASADGDGPEAEQRKVRKLAEEKGISEEEAWTELANEGGVSW